jgi:hypothetical protein
MPDDEIWKEISGWEGHYEVSTVGRVRSVTRIRTVTRGGVTYQQAYPGKIRSIHPVTAGYLAVELIRGKVKTYRLVHGLVGEAFLGPRPDGLQCAHLNGNKRDNRLSNLSYVTAKENAAHKWLHGTVPHGAKHWKAKVDEADVREIRRRRAAGALLRELAAEFGLSTTMISDIASRKAWAHLG